MEKEKIWKICRIISYIIIAVTIVCGVVLMVKLYNMGVLPVRYFILAVVLLLIIPVIGLLFRNKKVPLVILMVLSLIVCVAELKGFTMLDKADDTIDEVTKEGNTQVTAMEIRVLADSSASSVSDLKQYTIGLMKKKDRDYADKVLKEIKNSMGTADSGDIPLAETSDDTLELVRALYDGDADAIIINSAYAAMLEETEEYKDFNKETKIVHVVEIKELMESKNEQIKDFNITEDSFVVYVSGIDTYGGVTTKSRSDVNILMAVNTSTKQILLVNTPRDYYVPLPISNGVKDKLTHAGNYGVDVSIGTLEMLYGIDVNYHLRMNFTGFITIIDALGGIDVESDFDFTASANKNRPHFVKGMNYGLSGEQALAFARERYSFGTGDRQRGKNQMKVIKAIISEMASSDMLYNYSDVMEAIAGSFQTNFTSDEIYNLVKMQINDMASWDIETYSVDGKGDNLTSYSMPNYAAYVMIPDQSTVDTAKEKINAVLNGKNR